MYYFLPAWYGQNKIWQSDNITWYQLPHKIEFDDTINQIRVFKETNTPAELIILQYFPNLRYFLHRQDLFEVNSINIFDKIQGIPEELEQNQILLEDFEWSDSVEFVYTPFIVMVYDRAHHIGNVYYGPDGNIVSIVLLENNQKHKEYVMDDRGFISSIIYYTDDKPFYQDYLNLEGEWVIRELLLDSQMVTINPKFQDRFRQSEYASIDKLIFEKYYEIEGRFTTEDVLVVAASEIHNGQVLLNHRNHFKTVFSFFSHRVDITDTLNVRLWAYAADLIITDTTSAKNEIIKIDPFFIDKTHRISSFDTRLRLGSSQQRKESKIYFYVHPEQVTRKVIHRVLELILDSELNYVVFAMYNADVNSEQRVTNLIEEVINTEYSLEQFEVVEEESENSEDELLEESAEPKVPEYRYVIKNYNNELEVIKELEYTRLIVDLSEEPDLYTQIAGISAGIPQINTVETEYVEHLKNGYIIEKSSKLLKAANYYLKTLKPWNESLIYSVDKIRENTGNRMIQKWEKWLRKS